MKTSVHILIDTEWPQAGLPPERFLAVEKEKTLGVKRVSVGVFGFRERYTDKYRKLLLALAIAMGYQYRPALFI